MRNKKVYVLVLAALITAIDIIFTRLLGFDIPTLTGPVRINLELAIAGLSGYLLGPIWASLALVASDLLGMILYTGSLTFSPAFTISAAIKGILFGLIYHNKKTSFARTVIGITGVHILVIYLMNTFWLSLMLSTPYIPMLLARIPQLLLIPINVLFMHILLIAIEKIKIKKRAD